MVNTGKRFRYVDCAAVSGGASFNHGIHNGTSCKDCMATTQAGLETKLIWFSGKEFMKDVQYGFFKQL
jgi:hypothetical protein